MKRIEHDAEWFRQRANDRRERKYRCRREAAEREEKALGELDSLGRQDHAAAGFHRLPGQGRLGASQTGRHYLLYGSKWEPKQSKPKTEYGLSKDGYIYKVSKTEYDFAVYLTEHKENLGRG